MIRPVTSLLTLATALLLPLQAVAIDKDDPLEFKGTWEGPDSTKHSLHGVKITIKDKTAGATPDITGFVLNGKFNFTSPRDNYTFDVILEPTFPGVSGTSATVATGGGAGGFSVKKGIITTNAAGDLLSTAKGNTYTFNLGQKLDHNAAQTKAQKVQTTASEGDVWSAFHAMADMVKEAKKQLAVDKAAFSVVFPADFSYFDGTDIFMLRLDRYDWDVTAHEFGHAIGKEASAEDPNASPGGSHDGSNQYDYNPPGTDSDNPGTFQKKDGAIGLAFSEGFGTWFGGALLERSVYKGKFPNVADGKYTDTEDGSGVGDPFDSSTSPAYGPDTENAIYHLLWDLHDARNEANTRTNAQISGLRDRTSLGIKGVWDILKGKSAKSFSNFWVNGFLPGKVITPFLPAPGAAVGDVPALKKALAAAESVAEFGIAATLHNPKRGEKIELTPMPGDPRPEFKWTQLSGALNDDLKLNKHQLVIYSGDLSKLLFKKDGLPNKATSYTLTDADLIALKTEVDKIKDAGGAIATVVAAVVSESTTKTTHTGPYLSNGVELLIQDFNRAVVAVVDSSGSNGSTDPTDQRVVASKESIRRLVSLADAATSGDTPDIAASIDFDSSVTILSNFADPDSVIPTLDRINSSGGTSIDSGINAAVNLIDNIDAGGFLSFFLNRSGILVFTDGENNSGDGPVIQAIANATAKGIRVHYGFLQPLIAPAAPLNKAANGDHDPDKPKKPADLADKGDLPATIEEAVLQSGGVFGIIGDAESQVAFVNQVFNRGITNADDSGATGGAIAGQTETSDQLTDEQDIIAFDFNGAANEEISIIVETNNFQPNVTIFDGDGGIIGFDTDEDDDGRSQIDLTLPESGTYTVQIFAEDDGTGLFTVFVDVANPGTSSFDLGATSTMSLNRQTGLFEQVVTVNNTGAADAAGFFVDIAGVPDGTTVYNGTPGAAPGTWSIAFDSTVSAGSSVEIVVEYFVPTLVAPATVVTVRNETPAAQPDPVGQPLAITRMVNLGTRGFLLEWNSKPGTTYFIQYMDGGAGFVTVQTPVVANGNRVQWIDNGPPKTANHPSAVSSRIYRIIEVSD